jgi:quercetin dioxygenase-like cupin family protein
MVNDGPVTAEHTAIPPDDPQRRLVVASPDEENELPRVRLGANTDTILLTGADTAGRYTLIEIGVPAGSGPPPHRHDFEETFIVLDGEVEFTFRGQQATGRAGHTVHVPAGAPHAFRNTAGRPARLLCLCSPPGFEDFVLAIGDSLAAGAEPPTQRDEAAEAASIAKTRALAQQYRIELL